MKPVFARSGGDLFNIKTDNIRLDNRLTRRGIPAQPRGGEIGEGASRWRVKNSISLIHGAPHILLVFGAKQPSPVIQDLILTNA
ncbi:hypothetical protein [Sulfitobacter geojensis]|uniref:hypothetical protein n=1 Tax=Sulfitobacter geojensis TaxID=1342299 RepID=UPI0036DF34D2